jgi:hypothetical protein
MDLTLEAIKFNHDPNSATTDSFAVRRNETQPITERQRSISVKPEDSPAAYACDQTSGQTLTIKAEFRCSDPRIKRLKVQAVDGHLRFAQLRNLSYLERFALKVLRPLLRRILPANVLGEVIERDVVFNNGVSGLETFELKNVRIQNVGVGVNDIIWCWQFSLNSASWTNFATTNHRIYTVLSLPKHPWEPNSDVNSNTQLPWTEALEYACRWGAGATDTRDALKRITREVNKLGNGILQFDSVGHGSQHLTYDDPTSGFDCGAFLDILAGRSDNIGGFVNCDDCAAIVASFANLLGGDTPVSLMFPPKDPEFPLKRHLRIGTDIWQRGFFIYHAAAWEGRLQDEVCDAYLQLDGSDDESGNPVPLLAANIPFAGPKNYRFRLVATGHESQCQPLNGSTVRRRIGVKKDEAMREMSNPRLEMVKRRYDYEKWKQKAEGGFVHVKDLFGEKLLAWRVKSTRTIPRAIPGTILQSFWESGGSSESILRIDAYESHSADAVDDTLLQLLSQFQLPGMQYHDEAGFGDVVFSSGTNLVILFSRANLVFLMRNVGNLPVEILEEARFIDELVSERSDRQSQQASNELNDSDSSQGGQS